MVPFSFSLFFHPSQTSMNSSDCLIYFIVFFLLLVEQMLENNACPVSF